jgi:hypothetical protein
MGLQDWANIATIFGVISIPVSGGFIFWQLKHQTRLARAANVQSLVELSSPFNLQLVQDKNLAEYWVHGKQKYKDYDAVEKCRFSNLVSWWLILHENIFFQHRNNLIDRSAYDSWQCDLRRFCDNQVPLELWTELRDAFQSEFQKHVDCFMKEHIKAKTPFTSASEITSKP